MYTSSYLDQLSDSDTLYLLTKLKEGIPRDNSDELMLEPGLSKDDLVDLLRTVYRMLAAKPLSAATIQDDIRLACSSRNDDYSGRLVVPSVLDPELIAENKFVLFRITSRALDQSGLICTEITYSCGKSTHFYSSSIRNSDAVGLLLSFWGECVGFKLRFQRAGIW